MVVTATAAVTGKQPASIGRSCCGSSGENAPERQPELEIENGVNDWIKGRVWVAEPGEKFEDDWRNARLAEGSDNIDAKEWHPADEKCAHNNTESDGCFVIRDVITATVPVGRMVAPLASARVSSTSSSSCPIVDFFFASGRIGFVASEDYRSTHCLYVLYVHFGVEEETRIDGQHDETRQIEADARRNDGVSWRQVEGALR